MTVIYYAKDYPISPAARDILVKARTLAFGEDEVDFIETEPGIGALNFGLTKLPDDAVRTLSIRDLRDTPNAEYIVAAAMRQYAGTLEYRAPKPGRALWLDLESHGEEDRWKMSPHEFIRLLQYSWDNDPEVHLVTSLDHVLSLVEEADVVIAHNGHAFDFSVMWGKDSLRALELALQDKFFDSYVFAGVAFPAPPKFLLRNGRVQKTAGSPKSARKWFGLDNLAYQFGVPGKMGDLEALAEEFGGFSAIPLDDPRFLAYARQDVTTMRLLVSAMLQFCEPDDYDWREQRNAAIRAQISRNGFQVDEETARLRNRMLEANQQTVLAHLKQAYGFPDTGKMPWRSNAGKQAILDFLSSGGIFPEEEEDWPRTDTGNISLGGKALVDFTVGTPLAEDAMRIAEIMGQRTLSQLTLDHLQPDGCVHPEIDMLQRSGRDSVTKPGLTVFNGPEKSYFVARPGHVLVSVDYQAADGRAVAAMSGDEEYAKRFEPGADAHELTGRASFGDEEYDSDPVLYRNMSKPITHGSNYQMQAKKLAKMLKISVERATQMLNNYNETYKKVKQWQNRVVAEGNQGWVRNLWGRRMPVERGRAFTQSPGLLGQSTTREIICDGMLRIAAHNLEWVRFIKVPVHDEVIFEIPVELLDEVVSMLPSLMETTVNGIDFPIQVGKPSQTWQEATH